MRPSAAHLVWNRACAPVARGTRVGDGQLWHLLALHSSLMSDGFADTVRRHGPAAVERAAAACDYFDLAALGVLLRELPELVTRRDEADLLASYLLLGRDDMLYAAFEHSLATRPDDDELVG